MAWDNVEDVGYPDGATVDAAEEARKRREIVAQLSQDTGDPTGALSEKYCAGEIMAQEYMTEVLKHTDYIRTRAAQALVRAVEAHCCHRPRPSNL